MKRLLALTVVWLLIGGCAAVPRSHDRRANEVELSSDLERAQQQLERDERELMGTRAESRPVDCPRARQLADNICALAERICALAAGNPPDPAPPEPCTDARRRCKAGRERVQSRCPK